MEWWSSGAPDSTHEFRQLCCIEMPVHTNARAKFEAERLNADDSIGVFDARSPPARNTGTVNSSRIRRLICQSCTRPVPPSSLTCNDGFPESSRSASTYEETFSASLTDASDRTWMTCTSYTWGSARLRHFSSLGSTASTSWIAVVRQIAC